MSAFVELTPSTPTDSPNDQFPGRVATELSLSAILILVLTANFVLIIKLKVYSNCNSMGIMMSVTVILCLRLITYLMRVIQDKYSHE